MWKREICPDSKVHGANMGPTWVLSAPDGPHVGPMNLAIRVVAQLVIAGLLSRHVHCADYTMGEEQANYSIQAW